jgi:tRNA nucleotidyltransferase/poly(A) polymerase
VIYALQEALPRAEGVYLVGGMVRDAYRGAAFRDIDLACEGDGHRLARRIADRFGGAYYPLDEGRGVGRAIFEFEGQSYTADVASFRADNLLDDLRDRDFTINAMAVPLQGDLQTIYDPLGGMQDWGDKILRRCSPSSLWGDPLRVLRALRMSLAYGLKIEPQTLADIKAQGPRIMETSPERVRDELWALVALRKNRAAFQLLRHLGLVAVVLPELEALEASAWGDFLLALEKLDGLLNVIGRQRDDNIAANAAFGTFVYLLDIYRAQLEAYLAQAYPEERRAADLLTWALLLRSAPALGVEAFFDRFHLSSHELNHLNKILGASTALPALWDQGGALGARDIYRYWQQFGEGGLGGLLLRVVDYLRHHQLDFQAPDWTARLLVAKHILAGAENAWAASALVTGDDLMQHFDLRPGPVIGQLLAALREANALGEIHHPEEALAWADTWLAQASE